MIIAPAKSGTVEYKYWGVNLKTSRGTSVLEMPRIGTNFETASGRIFIGTNRSYYKTANEGKTWKHVHDGGLVGHLAESDGVLLGISMRKIIRSTDNGENWALVISDSCVAVDVKHSRGLRTSYDAGKTWQPNDAGHKNKVLIDSIWRSWNDRPRVQAFTTSITQIGENLFSIHHKGIFKFSDKGKTWKLILPAVKDKFFNLFISGNVIYAIPRSSKGGC